MARTNASTARTNVSTARTSPSTARTDRSPTDPNIIRTGIDTFDNQVQRRGGNPSGGPMQRRLRAALAAGLAVTVGAALAATAAARPAIAENNGLAVAAPPMGWSGYSFLRNDPTAAGMEAQADAMKSSGLSSH